MTVSNTYKNVIKGFEGLELTAYNKDGRFTIGYGCTFYENGQKVHSGDKITQARAETLFTNILTAFSENVNSLLKVSLSQNQFDALVSLAYNIGLTNFKNSTLLKLVNTNPNDTNIKNEFGKWIYSGGKKENGLINRRASEADYYFSKDYSASPNIAIALTAIVGGLIVYKLVKK